METSTGLTLPATERLRVLLALENVIKRRGLERIVADTVTVDLLCVDGDGPAVVPAPSSEFDVLVVALRELTKAKRAAVERCRQRGVKVLVLLDAADSRDRAMAASACADGFLDEAELTPSRLADALACISNGDIPIHAKLAREVLARADNGPVPPSDALQGMTPPEREVLVLLVNGLSNKQIARRLGISEHGAKRLVGKIMVRFGCQTRTAAVALAVRSGVVGSGLVGPAEETGVVERPERRRS
jgi:two-component system nitrate/nitrite response regulator NarL